MATEVKYSSKAVTLIQPRHNLAGSGRRGIRRSGIKEEAAGRGTAAELNAPLA